MTMPRTGILFISRSFPADFERATYGIFIRLRMLLEGVRPLADDLRVLFFVDADVSITEELRARTEDEMRQRWAIDARVALAHEQPPDPAGGAWAHYARPMASARLHPDFAGTAGSAQVAAVARCIDAGVIGIFAHRLGAMWPLLRGGANLPPIFFDLDDIEHRKLMRELHSRAFYPGKLAAYMRVPSLLAGERQAVRRASVTFVCSEPDRRYLQRLVGSAPVCVIPNVATVPATATPDPGQEVLLFLGSYTYGPNVDAANHLLTRIWPRIHAERPRATLLIAGQRAERIPGYAAPPPGVTFTGFVPDLAALYAQVRVVCCPIQVAGGTRIKIIEAAGHGRAVVSTATGAEGLEFRAPDEIRIARTDAEFATECANLLADPVQARAVGSRARQRAMAVYDRNAVVMLVREQMAARLRLVHQAGARA